ncbi:MAG: chitobiase/beta-hexosaminidase C-terminal domain-containing protein [Muribaculaceae bacterium]|nr:chitobiase/beta-hexosaminidase C-terminal domain-containing protein [Muribaculaceae bacterium]
MKKLFSLLFVSMLALSAWADFTVTFIPGETVGSNSSANKADQMTKDGITVSCTTAAFNAAQYRFAAGSTATFTSTVGNIKKVEFTCVGTYNDAYGPNQFYGEGYTTQSGSKVGKWQGDAATFQLNTASQVRCTQIVFTIAEETVEELVAPVFHPDGGEFTGSLAVTLTCATENAQIFWFYGTEEDQGMHNFYNGPIYVTETTTLTAYSVKGEEISDYVTVTFTKVELTVDAPEFTPASCYFRDRLDVTLTCATPGATIYYSLDNELWSVYVDAIPVTEDITIWAKAVVGDVESETAIATYTKLPDTTVDVTFDATVDKGNGDVNRHSYTIVKEHVTMYVGDGTVYEDHYRMYNSDSTALNFTSTGQPIIRIEFKGLSGYTASNLSLAEGNEGTWTTGGNDGVWEGMSQFVAFKINRQVRFTEIIVTLAGEDVPAFVRGDVDRDGNVTISDVTSLIDYILNGNVSVVNLNAADCDESGIVDINDITVLIDYLLNGEWNN